MRRIDGSGGVGQSAYSIAFAERGCIFSKYVGVRDVERSRDGYVAFSVFIPNDRKLAGSDIQMLLDDLAGTYCQNYVADGNLGICREDWTFVTCLAREYESRTVSADSEEDYRQGSAKAAFAYYSSSDELQRYFDVPCQQEYKDFKQVLLIENGLPDLLGLLQHDPNANLTGKIKLDKIPEGKHVQEALEQERRRIQAAKSKVLFDIKNNPNTYVPQQIKDYWQNGTITRRELQACDIPDDVIEAILESDLAPVRLNFGYPPDSIPSGYTEMYFWGIPGSGKTCALAALLSTAHKAGYLNIAAGPGCDYMIGLKNIFSDDLAVLPPPTPVDTMQYLPFTLQKTNEKHPRCVSLIELSGENFQCFLYLNAGKGMPTEYHRKTFDMLRRFLSGDNRKIHFFFIDCDRQNKKDNYGYLQSDYLEAAATYFTDNEVFGKSTDAIYVALTKSDLMRDEAGNKVPADKRKEYAEEYLNKEGFKSFVSVLKGICKKHSINSGRLTIEPFSLGKVYFQQICRFDDSSANNIIEILIDRIKPNKKSFLGRVFNR
jgi:hypothetical protein